MLISVILPVYNAQPFLAAALDSIATQTCGDFECIIIDDGSTDGSPSIADRYVATDTHFRVIHTPNHGLVSALNHGISLATGKYLARMDADDISMPERFARQSAFLEAHPEIALCGTFAQTIGHAPPQFIKHPTDPDFIFASMIFRCPLIHPTIMMRGDIHPQYDAHFKHCEDYQLWAQLALRYRFANIPEPLLQYRVHAGQVSVQYQTAQQTAADDVWLFLLNQLGIQPTLTQRALHRVLSWNQLEPTDQFVDAADQWLLTLLTANARHPVFPQHAFAVTLARRWRAVCDGARALPSIDTIFKASPLFAYIQTNLK